MSTPHIVTCSCCYLSPDSRVTNLLLISQELEARRLGFDSVQAMQAAAKKGFQNAEQMAIALSLEFETYADQCRGFENGKQMRQAEREGCKTLVEWDRFAKDRGFRSATQRWQERVKFKALLDEQDLDLRDILRDTFEDLKIEAMWQMLKLQESDVDRVHCLQKAEKRQVKWWINSLVKTGGFGLSQEDLAGAYQPIAKFSVRSPTQGCTQSIKKCNQVLLVDEGLLVKSIEEVNKICDSRLGAPAVQNLLRSCAAIPYDQWRPYLAAIVMYTFDVNAVHIGSKPPDNFYHKLNSVLRTRDPSKLQMCSDYLHYLHKGLESLPSYGLPADSFLWRGVDYRQRATFLERYKKSVSVHWSAFSSATTVREKAMDFAQNGGLLLRISLLDKGSVARDLCLLSAWPSENEVLLLPNMKLKVTQGLRKLEGFDTIDLLEEAPGPGQTVVS